MQKTKKKEVYFDEKKMVGHAHIGTVPRPKIKELYMRGITMDKSMNIFAFSMNLVYVVLEHLVYKCDL